MTTLANITDRNPKAKRPPCIKTLKCKRKNGIKGGELYFLTKEVAAKVAVDENGNAGLKQIYIDNEPWP